jgi:hypothetical protein
MGAIRRFSGHWRLAPVVLLIGTMIAAEEQAPNASDRPPNELPNGWSERDIRDACLAHRKGNVFVLAWKTLEGDGNIRVETFLALTIFEEGNEARRWCLEHRRREPAAKNPIWELLYWHETGAKPSVGRWRMSHKDFDRTPTNKDIYASLEDIRWTFALVKGVKYINCGICEKNWHAALRERPVRFFGAD